MKRKEPVLKIIKGQRPVLYDDFMMAAVLNGIDPVDMADMLEYGGKRRGMPKYMYLRNWRGRGEEPVRYDEISADVCSSAPAPEPQAPAPSQAQPEVPTNKSEPAIDEALEKVPPELLHEIAAIYAVDKYEQEHPDEVNDGLYDAGISAEDPFDLPEEDIYAEEPWLSEELELTPKREPPEEPIMEDPGDPGNRLFILTGPGEYRAMLEGKYLTYAKGAKTACVPLDPAEEGRYVDLRNTAWLNATEKWPRGICGSIRNEKFDNNAMYAVYFVPDGAPPYLFAIRKG